MMATGAQALDFAQEIWAMAKQAGPFATALMFYLWRAEREERREKERQLPEIAERATKGLHDNAMAIQALRDLFSAGRGK